MNKACLALIALLIAIMTAACGAATEQFSASAPAPAAPAQAPPAPAMAESMPAPAAPAVPAPAAAAAPAPAQAADVQRIVVEKEVAEEAQTASDTSQVGEFDEAQVALIAQNRIIVRTVNLNLEVQDVANAIDVISESVQQSGGWVVNSDRSSTHYGFISVRVPAGELDSSLEWMRDVGVDVLSESSTSTDVTDEYYDLRSRVKSLQATETALLKLLDKAEKVEDALEVQRELARLQVEIEAHLGRIKLLEETAAFSLVHIALNLAPVNMQVDAGPDKTFSVGELVRFRATFAPPEGIDDFKFTWDFGDGTPPVSGNGSAPTTDAGRRITATVNHVYNDDRDSPYIVEVSIIGTGDAGIVEGADTFIASVSQVPAIVVFAGDHRVVEEDSEETYSGSFTRPKGLTNYKYSWDFGDGSASVSGAPEEGATTVETLHTFDNHRPASYTVTLTISAESDAGTVLGSSSFEVFVEEAQGLVISGWSAGDTLKDSVRALSGVAQVLGTMLIWLAIFSPVWIVLAILVFVIVRFRSRLIRTSRQSAIAANDAARQPANTDE